MGRRHRQRERLGASSSEKLSAATTEYADADGNVLDLRGSLTPGRAVGVRPRPPRRTRPRGRLATRDRAAVRAARGLVDDLRRSRSIARRSCSDATGWPPRRNGRSFVTPCASTPRSTSPSWRPRERRLIRPRLDADAFAALICDWCLEVQAGSAGDGRDHDARPGAGTRAPPGAAAARRLAAAAALPARAAGGVPPARAGTASRRLRARSSWPRCRRSTRPCGSTRRPTRAPLGGSIRL